MSGGLFLETSTSRNGEILDDGSGQYTEERGASVLNLCLVTILFESICLWYDRCGINYRMYFRTE